MIRTVYTARDVREAERVSLGMSLDMIRHAPPPAIDPAASTHARRLASLWREISLVHAEYAAELEREQRAGSKPTRGKSSLLTSRPERTEDPMRVGVGLGWCSS
jgi:hypothetical protein